jgi:hypothetical protein
VQQKQYNYQSSSTSRVVGMSEGSALNTHMQLHVHQPATSRLPASAWGCGWQFRCRSDLPRSMSER